MVNTSKSKYAGVRCKNNGRYTAEFRHKNVYKHLGTFDSEEEAARAYDQAKLAALGPLKAGHLNFKNSYPEVRQAKREDNIKQILAMNYVSPRHLRNWKERTSLIHKFPLPCGLVQQLSTSPSSSSSSQDGQQQQQNASSGEQQQQQKQNASSPSASPTNTASSSLMRPDPVSVEEISSHKMSTSTRSEGVEGGTPDSSSSRSCSSLEPVYDPLDALDEMMKQVAKERSSSNLLPAAGTENLADVLEMLMQQTEDEKNVLQKSSFASNTGSWNDDDDLITDQDMKLLLGSC